MRAQQSSVPSAATFGMLVPPESPFDVEAGVRGGLRSNVSSDVPDSLLPASLSHSVHQFSRYSAAASTRRTFFVLFPRCVLDPHGSEGWRVSRNTWASINIFSMRESGSRAISPKNCKTVTVCIGPGTRRGH